MTKIVIVIKETKTVYRTEKPTRSTFRQSTAPTVCTPRQQFNLSQSATSLENTQGLIVNKQWTPRQVSSAAHLDLNFH